MAIRIGDWVEVVTTYGGDSAAGVIEGLKYQVTDVTGDNRFYVKTPKRNRHLMFEHQISKVSCNKDGIKEGDIVKVAYVTQTDRYAGVRKDQEYTVTEIDELGDVYIAAPVSNRHFMMEDQIVKAEQKEVVQYDESFNYTTVIKKLIRGEFTEGSELIAKSFPYVSSYNVVQFTTGEYGLKVIGNGRVYTVDELIRYGDGRVTGAVWKVKQPEQVKEMTISELQDQLGYKVKIVE